MKLWGRFQAWREGRTKPLALDVPRAKKKAEIVCPCCRKKANSWRRYADGKQECIACAEKKKR